MFKIASAKTHENEYRGRCSESDECLLASVLLLAVFIDLSNEPFRSSIRLTFTIHITEAIENYNQENYYHKRNTTDNTTYQM